MARLLSKAETALAGLVSKEANRPALECVHVTEKFSEVTNGHYLVRVPACEIKAEEFPTVPGMGNGTASELLIPGKALADAAKAVPKKPRIPVLETLHVGKNDLGHTVTTSTDLENPCVRTFFAPDVQFPPTDRMLADLKPGVMRFALSAAYLKTLAAYVGAHGTGHAPAITFTIVDAKSPIRMEFTTEDGQQALIVLMPVTLPEDRKQAFSGVAERKAV